MAGAALIAIDMLDVSLLCARDDRGERLDDAFDVGGVPVGVLVVARLSTGLPVPAEGPPQRLLQRNMRAEIVSAAQALG